MPIQFTISLKNLDKDVLKHKLLIVMFLNNLGGRLNAW